MRPEAKIRAYNRNVLRYPNEVMTLVTCILLVSCTSSDIVQYTPPLPYRLGEIIAAEGIDFSLHDRTILLAIRESCGSCAASIDFYRQISDAVKKLPLLGRVQFLVVTSDDGNTVAAHLPAEGVVPDRVLSRRAGQAISLDTPRIPALILTDRRGQVLGAWVGELELHERGEVLAAIKRGI